MSRVYQMYRHYNKSGDLLYVGQSLNALARLVHHNGNSCWASQIAFIEIERFADAKALNEAEASAIASELPLYNQVLPTAAQIKIVVSARRVGRPRIVGPRPWEAEGVSKATYYRDRRRAEEKK